MKQNKGQYLEQAIQQFWIHQIENKKYLTQWNNQKFSASAPDAKSLLEFRNYWVNRLYSGETVHFLKFRIQALDYFPTKNSYFN